MIKIISYCPAAPSHGNARKWVRNRDAYVLAVDASDAPEDDPTVWSESSNCNSPAILREEFVGRGDSRYCGPRSEWGRISREQDALADEWTAQLSIARALESFGAAL